METWRQKRRVVQCAVSLVDRLQPYVAGTGTEGIARDTDEVGRTLTLTLTLILTLTLTLILTLILTLTLTLPLTTSH